MLVLHLTDACLCLWLQPISNADFIVPVEIDGIVHQVLLLHTSKGRDRSHFQVRDTMKGCDPVQVIQDRLCVRRLAYS